MSDTDIEVARLVQKYGPSVENRIHQIAREMPDMFPFGYAVYLAAIEYGETYE